MPREHIIEEILSQEVGLAGVETNGFQLSSFQELVREKRLRSVAFYPVSVNKDKVSRALLCSARGAAGKLFYRKNASWFETSALRIHQFSRRRSRRHSGRCFGMCRAFEQLPGRSPGGLAWRSQKAQQMER